MKSIFVLFLLAFFANGIGAQSSDPILGQIEVTGTFSDVTGGAMSDISIYIQKGADKRSFTTDVNGDFKLKLRPGEYQVTVNPTNSDIFRAFLKIQDGNLNPRDLKFVIDPAKVCCVTPDGTPYPVATALPLPPYPPAARAVRATGEVVVEVTIGTDGNVKEAKAVSGHPLLRAAARAAAARATFEGTANDSDRSAKLVYIFSSDDEPRAGIRRYSNPFQVRIVPNYQIDQ